jgi:decaprenyl-phosphate phosphoribosyltransferase
MTRLTVSPVLDAGAVPARTRTGALVSALRPRQWIKNLLVVAAPLAAGRLDEPHVLGGVAAAFVAFCLVSSSGYLLNDVYDVEQDRAHPEKCRRPIATGEVSVRTAAAVSAVLFAASMALAWWWTPALGATVLAYAGLQLSYLLSLKHQPGLDLAAVASGFLLRAVAGADSTGTTLSAWFLLVATFGALFVVAGKRHSEIRQQGDQGGTRHSLKLYTETYLRFIWTLAAGVTVMVYLLWALTGQNAPAVGDGADWAAISVGPFVLGVLRYAATIDGGGAEAPEDVVLSDRHLQVIGALWLLLQVCHATGL